MPTKHALPNQLTLELGYSPQHVEYEPAGWRCGVDCLVENLQPHALGIEPLTDLAEVRDAASRPVELGDHQHVTLTAHTRRANFSSSRSGATAETCSQNTFSQSTYVSGLLPSWYLANNPSHSISRRLQREIKAGSEKLPFQRPSAIYGASDYAVTADGGDYTRGVSLDLSLGAARAIGMRSTQTVSMKRC